LKKNYLKTFLFQIKFNLQDVQVPDIPGMFTTFRAKNVPLFVDGSQFVDPKHFGKIMGYDKPLNLRWDHESDKTESQKNREEEESKQKKY
jgi:transmembrane protein 70